MTYNFDRLIDRKSTSDIKWRTQGQIGRAHV